MTVIETAPAEGISACSSHYVGPQGSAVSFYLLERWKVPEKQNSSLYPITYLWSSHDACISVYFFPILSHLSSVRPFAPRNLFKRLHPVVRDMMEKMPGVKNAPRTDHVEGCLLPSCDAGVWYPEFAFMFVFICVYLIAFTMRSFSCLTDCSFTARAAVAVFARSGRRP